MIKITNTKITGWPVVTAIDRASCRKNVVITCDINAPLYWWAEFGACGKEIVMDSSLDLLDKEFAVEDFSTENLSKINAMWHLNMLIDFMNRHRHTYQLIEAGATGKYPKEWYYQQIRALLPSAYNHKRMVSLGCDTLSELYTKHKGDKSDEWCVFRRWVRTLPCRDLIVNSAGE